MQNDKVIARVGSRKRSRTTTVKVRILQYLDEHPRWFLVKKLASEIVASEAYTRKCCREMSQAGLIHVRNLHVAKEYCTKCYFPATLYRVKQSPDVPLPQVHSLTMKINYVIDRLGEHGIGIGTTFKFNHMYQWKWQPGRIISYKYGANSTLTIYLQATLNPLNFEDFKHFISFIEGLFKIPTWSQLDNWTVVQYGLNKDIFTMQTNEQITLSALGNFFSQVYDKKVLDPANPGEFIPVQRYEYHINEPIVANAFMDLFQGGVASYIQQQLAFSTNQLVRQNDTSNKGLIRLLENLIRLLRGDESAAAAPMITKGPGPGPDTAPVKRRTKKNV